MSSILELNHITKRYPGVVALDDVSVSFEQGEVHALLGENGAGKSTLIKILAGAISPDEGTVHMDGEALVNITPALSTRKGIGVIYQEFTLVPTLSVAENMFLGKEYRKGAFLDKKAMIEKAKEVLKELDVEIDPSVPVRQLSVAYQQIVEISKTLVNDVRVLVMDEPTAPLTNAEVESLFRLVKRLVANGVTILFISHRMEELFQIADRVTILRDGRYIKTLNMEKTTSGELISLMVGRSIDEQYPARESNIGETVLEVRNLCAGNFIRDVSFSVRAGEIVGLSGLIGAGRTELVRAIYGADPMTGGEVWLNGKRVELKSPAVSIAQGVALLPESRKEQGLVLKMSIADNLIMSTAKRLSQWIFLKKAQCAQIVADYIAMLRIKTPSSAQKVVNLSGGNQQKVVIGKFLAASPSLIFFDEPTRGIDVGAKHEIYQLMNKLVAEGKAIIMISSELPEILGMSDRVLVMHEGKLVAELDRSEATQERIMHFASGNAAAS
ncbi:MAG TPA: D-xylose ABC transporter ATP-binding protein [Lachnospiraceae bacterium]|nr:D-xylose ABC transporter ATP-binding protein [Lachnospiraceae bacterium]